MAALSAQAPTRPIEPSRPASRRPGRRRGSGIARVQGVVATPPCWSERRCSSRASAGVFQPRVLRGRLLSAAATASRSSALCRRGRCPWGSTGAAGRWCSRSCRAARGCAGRRSRSAGRCRCAAGRAGPSRRPGPRSATGAAARAAWRSCAAIASRTASAPCPASAGPFFTRGSSPWPSMRGRCSSIVNRVVRSTSVPIAELSSPMIRSPSQWPGHGPVLGLGGPLADHDLRGDELLAAPCGCGPGAPAAPARCAGRRPARGAARRGPGRTAPGRSPRARSASTHHRGSRPAAGSRSAPGSTTSPTAGPAGARGGDRSSAPSGPAPPRRRAR